MHGRPRLPGVPALRAQSRRAMAVSRLAVPLAPRARAAHALEQRSGPDAPGFGNLRRHAGWRGRAVPEKPRERDHSRPHAPPRAPRGTGRNPLGAARLGSRSRHAARRLPARRRGRHPRDAARLTQPLPAR
ncbi:hypothetical protein BCEN4_50024 [Burkholderia cenocepacia]|nr:hypothetical protein BCEN4_50024 [Burkholderia cenocepacia]